MAEMKAAVVYKPGGPEVLQVQVGRVFRLDEIVEAHRCMDENKAGGKIVVLT
jgi:NADPH:quinone reductase-like Zn-dependent oxidoreductase